MTIEAADVAEVVLCPEEVLAHPVEILHVEILVLAVDACKREDVLKQDQQTLN